MYYVYGEKSSVSSRVTWDRRKRQQNRTAVNLIFLEGRIVLTNTLNFKKSSTSVKNLWGLMITIYDLTFMLSPTTITSKPLQITNPLFAQPLSVSPNFA